MDIYSLFKPTLSGVPQRSFLGLLLSILYTADMWHNLKNAVVTYADMLRCMHQSTLL